MTAAKKLKVRSAERIRVLIADTDSLTSRRTLAFLAQNGFDCRLAHTGSEVKKILLTWKPRILLVDLLLPEANAFEILHYIQTEPHMRRNPVAVMVMSAHNTAQNVHEAYERGARDYLARPIMFRDLLARVVFNCRDPREISGQESTSQDAMQLSNLVVAQALQPLPFEEALFSLTKMAAMKVKGRRCSIVQQVTHEKGVVLASNDKKDIAGLALDLKKYPEIRLVVHTSKPVVIDNLSESRALSQIKSQLKDIDFNSMVVCPIHYHQKVFGVLSMRMPPSCSKVEDSDIHFLEFVAKVLSLYLNSVDPQVLGRFGLISA